MPVRYSIPLRYFIDSFAGRPGFLEIVLKNHGKLYLQMADINGIVREFEEVNIEDSVLLESLSGRDVATIGRQAWYGFRNNDGDVIIQQWQAMRDYLYENFADYSEMPFLSYEIAEFLEDVAKRAVCADLIMQKKDLFDASSWLGSEYLSPGVPVLSLWKKSFPGAFSQLQAVLQPSGFVKPAIQQLAYEMWKNSVWNTQCAWDYWLAAEKHVLILTAAVICSPSSSAKEANALAPVLSVVSGAAHLQLIERVAHGIWEQTGRQYGIALDHWLAAEKQVLAASVAVIESSSDAQQAMRNLPGALESLDPAKIREPIRILSEAMWEQAGRQPGQALDFWVAAEKHVLTLTVAAIRQAPAGSKLAEVVAKTFTAFSPLEFLETISETSQSMWQQLGRQTSRTMDYWLNAELKILAATADGKGTNTLHHAA